MKKKNLEALKKEAVKKSLDSRMEDRRVEKIQRELDKVNRTLTIKRWVNWLSFMLVICIS